MKVYVVKSMDTNGVISIDQIFVNKKDAERYAAIQEEKYNFVTFIIAEYQVFSDAGQCGLDTY